MFISKKKLNALECKAFLDGFEEGYDAGKAFGLNSRFTPNEIRKAIGLDPLHVVKIDKLVIPELDEETRKKYLEALKEDLKNGGVIFDENTINKT